MSNKNAKLVEEFNEWLKKAQYYEERKLLKQAYDCYAKAVSINNDRVIWLKMGNISFRALQAKTAVECYQRALEIKDDDSGAWFNLGVAAYFSKQEKLAIESLEKALDMGTEFDYEAWNYLGAIYDTRGDYKESIECFKKAVKIKDDLHKSWYNLARSYAKERKENEVYPNLRKAIELEPQYREIARKEPAFLFLFNSKKFRILVDL